MAACFMLSLSRYRHKNCLITRIKICAIDIVNDLNSGLMSTLRKPLDPTHFSPISSYSKHVINRYPDKSIIFSNPQHLLTQVLQVSIHQSLNLHKRMRIMFCNNPILGTTSTVLGAAKKCSNTMKKHKVHHSRCLCKKERIVEYGARTET